MFIALKTAQEKFYTHTRRNLKTKTRVQIRKKNKKMNCLLCVCVCVFESMGRVFFLFLLIWFLGCYSGLEEQICKEGSNGSANDMIYWHRQCTRIKDICEEHMMLSYDNSLCQNATSGELKPVRQIIRRVLASEEYY